MRLIAIAVFTLLLLGCSTTQLNQGFQARADQGTDWIVRVTDDRKKRQCMVFQPGELSAFALWRTWISGLPAPERCIRISHVTESGFVSLDVTTEDGKSRNVSSIKFPCGKKKKVKLDGGYTIVYGPDDRAENKKPKETDESVP